MVERLNKIGVPADMSLAYAKDRAHTLEESHAMNDKAATQPPPPLPQEPTHYGKKQKRKP